MCKIFRAFPLLVLLFALSNCAYLQFPLVRSRSKSDHYKNDPIVCKNETTLNQDAEYHEICYEKDISYSIPFMNQKDHYHMSVDLTAPISWIKASDCKIQGTSKRCNRVFETFTEKVRQIKTKISNKLHKKNKKLVENAIIEGSSQIIRGEIQKSQNITFIAKNSDRLNNFFELILLGLFIYGEHDQLMLENTNFINATEISANLNDLSDGAISMRFDQASQNSFLNELFTYVKAADKTVTLFLGHNNSITIGDLTAKNTETGYSSITWIDMIEDQGFGKLPKINDIGMQDRRDDTQTETPEDLTAVLTLSASYIGLPEAAINAVFGKSAKQYKCNVNSKSYFLQCSGPKKKLQKIKEETIYFDFGGKNINIPLSSLIQKEEKSKIILNIKKTFNNRVILGQPVFLRHFIALDYSKNRFGFAEQRKQFNQFFVSVVSLVRFLCFVFVLGCSFIICFQPCRRMLKVLSGRNWGKGGEAGQGRRLKQYSPIQENPYEQLKGKIQDVISNNEKEDQVQGI